MDTSVWSTPDVPLGIRDKVREELLRAVATPSVKNQFQALGMEAENTSQSIDDLVKMLKQEYERTGQMLRAPSTTSPECCHD